MKCAVVFYGDMVSVFTLDYCLRQGYDVQCLLTIRSEDASSMFCNSVSRDLLDTMSVAIEIPLTEYTLETEQELFELEGFLSELKQKYGLEGIAFGNISDRLQHIEVQNVCRKLGMQLIAPLWHQDHTKALQYMIAQGYIVLISAVSGIKREWLGEILDTEKLNALVEWQRKENSSFETLVIDGPVFKQGIEIKIGYPETQDDYKGRYLVKEVKLLPKS